MAYGRGRRSGVLKDMGCPQLCGKPTVKRVTQPEKIGIPTSPVTHSVFHCLHCDFIWFESKKPRNIVPVGRYRNSQFVAIPDAEFSYPEPKSPTRASVGT